VKGPLFAASPSLNAPDSPAKRLRSLHDLRATLERLHLVAASQHDNGDEQRYADRRYPGSFAKGLAHSGELGLVDPVGYRTYLRAIRTGNPRDLSAIPTPFLRSLIASVIDLDFAYEGDDATQFALPPAPMLASATTAAELIELYWAAVARDVPLTRYADDPQIAAACAELSSLGDIAGFPRSGTAIEPTQIFRAAGRALEGPLISQFYWIDIVREPLGGAPQALRFARPGKDYLIDRDGFVAAQSTPEYGAEELVENRAYVYSLRCLADCLGRAGAEAVFANAEAFLASLDSSALQPFYDPVVVRELCASAQALAGRAIYFQKLLVHRRVRPEAVGWLLDLTRRGHAMPLHASLVHAKAVAAVESTNGNALLPQAYPGGCPDHPSYPAAHSGTAGAIVTILKAFIVDDFPFPNPTIANDDGTALQPLSGVHITLGGELDKLAANFAYGRTAAGVHFRSDNHAGLHLGEAVALSVLRDRTRTMVSAGGFAVRTFDGKVVRP
jgi:hypothetical protein